MSLTTSFDFAVGVVRLLYRFGKELAHVALEAEGDQRQLIMVGLTLVDNHVRDAAAGRNQGKLGRGVDRERRAQGHDQIAGPGGLRSADQIIVLQALAKADRGLLEVPATGAPRTFLTLLERSKSLPKVSLLAAGLAFDSAVCAMELDQSIS